MRQGDWNGFTNFFSTNFFLPGGLERFGEVIGNNMKAKLRGLEIVSIGQPTNNLGGTKIWFVPYAIRFQDGSEKSFRLQIEQDIRTQRWVVESGLLGTTRRFVISLEAIGRLGSVFLSAFAGRRRLIGER